MTISLPDSSKTTASNPTAHLAVGSGESPVLNSDAAIQHGAFHSELELGPKDQPQCTCEQGYRFEEAPLPIFVLDLSGSVMDANLAASVLCRRERENIIGRKLADFFAENQRGKLAQALEFLAAGLPLSTFEYSVYQGPTLVPVEILAKRIEGAKQSSILLYIRDLGEHDKTGLSLHQPEKRSGETNEAAAAPSNAQRELLASVSHDIRTPINGIIGMTDLALDTRLTAEQREYLTCIRNSADSLLVLVNQLLDFSKIEAQKLALDPIPFNLRDSLDKMLAIFAAGAHAKGLELACDVHPHVPEKLVGDIHRLQQIITNLAGNAIKFTKKGEVIVRVQADERIDNTLRLHFVVQDTGIGIPAAKQKLIFEPFSQADDSVSREYGGTGLGLAISSRLVELLGGTLWVESELGLGSAFHFTATVGLQPEQADSATTPPYTELRDVRVLVADDNITNGRILQTILSNWQMRPSVALDGRSALQMLLEAARGESPYKLVLADAVMPVMDGYALADQIATTSGLSNLPVIILAEAKSNVHECKGSISACLMKPIKQSALLDTLKTTLDNTSRHATSPVPGEPADLPQKQRHSLCILLAEDDAVSQLSAVRMLEKQGHTVVVAGNGFEALIASEQEKFDLIIMDAQMPVMNGFEATAAIREREKQSGRHTPIIALTAHAMESNRAQCVSCGMDSYVAKPVSIKELSAAIEKLVPEAPPGSHQESEKADDSDSRAIDRETILRRVDGDKALLAEIADLFLDDCPKLLAQIDDAIKLKNCKLLERCAHKLRGSLDLFASAAASRAALELERSGRYNDLRNIDQAGSILRKEIDRLLPELAALTRKD
jgi:two-component system, sensor histidine kinase and response regulator